MDWTGGLGSNLGHFLAVMDLMFVSPAPQNSYVEAVFGEGTAKEVMKFN